MADIRARTIAISTRRANVRKNAAMSIRRRSVTRTPVTDAPKMMGALPERRPSAVHEKQHKQHVETVYFQF